MILIMRTFWCADSNHHHQFTFNVLPLKFFILIMSFCRGLMSWSVLPAIDVPLKAQLFVKPTKPKSIMFIKFSHYDGEYAFRWNLKLFGFLLRFSNIIFSRSLDITIHWWTLLNILRPIERICMIGCCKWLNDEYMSLVGYLTVRIE